jgi:hypothetical protein
VSPTELANTRSNASETANRSRIDSHGVEHRVPFLQSLNPRVILATFAAGVYL